MRILFVSMLYPDSSRPNRAMFNYNHVRAITELGHEVIVISPVKSLPGGELTGLSPRLPSRETIAGNEVWHPRFYHLPLVGRHLQHVFYRMFTRRVFRRLATAWRPDHVLVGFAYPDAAAIGPLCEEMGLDWSVAVLGSDFYVRRRQRLIRDTLFETLQRAPDVFCPGQALKLAMADAGVPAEKIHDFRNGVDRSIFHPTDVEREPYVLFVGNLVPVKGIDRLLAAWKLLARRDLSLRLVGGGPLADKLRDLARSLGIAADVEFIPPLPQHQLAEQMRRARLVCLPSHSEGMPNVVLESLACGTPVVGSAVGETPYLLHCGRNGFLFRSDEDAAENLAAALRVALATSWRREEIVATVAGCTWEGAARTVLETIER